MNLLVSQIVGSIAEIVVLSVVPFVWWCLTSRKKQSFWKWIGLKKFKSTGKTFMWIAGATVAFILLGAFMLYTLREIGTATSEFAGLGWKAILPVTVYAAFKTAFPEEILFRGFLLKRIENKWGFTIGNIAQAAVFGLIHGVMFFRLAGGIRAVLIIAFTSAIALVMGIINERKADGSIIPSWIIHTTSNIFSGVCSAFLII